MINIIYVDILHLNIHSDWGIIPFFTAKKLQVNNPHLNIHSDTGKEISFPYYADVYRRGLSLK